MQAGQVGKVLIIEDSEIVRFKLTANLVALGFAVIEAENGAVGLELLQKNPDCSLVICDVHMPVVDGLGFLKSLRDGNAAGTLPGVPVLMLTGEKRDTLIDQGKALGVAGWVLKPFLSSHITAEVRRVLAARHPNASTA